VNFVTHAASPINDMSKSLWCGDQVNARDLLYKTMH